MSVFGLKPNTSTTITITTMVIIIIAVHKFQLWL
jgi:hypothetical protein